MLYLFTLALIIFVVFSKRIRNKQEFLLLTTLIYSVFFFDSASPVSGLPLYFIMSLFSIVFCIFNYDYLHKVNSKLVYLIVVCLISLIIPYLRIIAGKQNIEVLLIKESSTDSLDVSSQMRSPRIDFTLFKHFTFLIEYLIFLIFNRNIIKKNRFQVDFYRIFDRAYTILFWCFLLESLIVNITGINDRYLMQVVFSIKNLNQSENWVQFGIKSVAFCFTEKSGMSCVIIYYLLLEGRHKKNKTLLWKYLLSLIAVLLSESSSAFFISLVFGMVFVLQVLFNKKNTSGKPLALILIIAGLIVCSVYADELFDKIGTYFSNEITYGSASFRRQSNNYGMSAFLANPIFGVGLGTVYCHSLLIQTLSNIGIAGTLSVILIHCAILPKKKLGWNAFIITILTIAILSATFMVQNFTSPWLLALILSIYSNLKERNKIYSIYSIIVKDGRKYVRVKAM